MRPPLPRPFPERWDQPIRRTSVEPLTRGGIPVAVCWPALLGTPAFLWLVAEFRSGAVAAAVLLWLAFVAVTRLDPFWGHIVAQFVRTRVSRLIVAPRWAWRRSPYLAPR